jgi:hypothetical protein
VAEDAITTEEVLVVVLAEVVRAVTEVQLQEEKVVLLQDVKVLAADLVAEEVLLLEKVVLDQEVVLLQELVAFQTELLDHPKLQDVKAVPQKDRQDVLKVLVMLQEKKDQEEAKKD